MHFCPGCNDGLPCRVVEFESLGIVSGSCYYFSVCSEFDTSRVDSSSDSSVTLREIYRTVSLFEGPATGTPIERIWTTTAPAALYRFGIPEMTKTRAGTFIHVSMTDTTGLEMGFYFLRSPHGWISVDIPDWDKVLARYVPRGMRRDNNSRVDLKNMSVHFPLCREGDSPGVTSGDSLLVKLKIKSDEFVPAEVKFERNAR